MKPIFFCDRNYSIDNPNFNIVVEKQEHQYNHKIILHSRTAQCISFEYFLVSLCEFLITVTRLNKRLKAPFFNAFFFHSGPDIFDIHISHQRFLIEKEISITKWYKWLHDIFAKYQLYCRISLVRPVVLKRGVC